MTQLLTRVCESYLPSTWSRMASWEDEKCVELAKNSCEYITVCSPITSALPIFSKITKVVRIQNPYLWGCYLLKKEEYARRGFYCPEKKLYHNTCNPHAESIIKNNFNWRCSGRRAKYGRGVSFSYSAQYALCNSSYSNVLIVARVLVGKTADGSWYQEIPQDGVDTTTSGGVDCNVYVKYSDHEFYPEYLVYH